MSEPIFSFVDLEGVLVPEMWPHLASTFGIAELMATTREVADYRLLMNGRIAALAKHRVTLADVCAVVGRLDPFEGAVEFIRALKDHGRIVIVSDSFRPMNRHFLEALPIDDALCHDFRWDKGGMIAGMRFWNGLAGKHLCFDAFDLTGYRTFAMGDALNDLSMIRSAEKGVLFRASPTTLRVAGDLQPASTYADALAALTTLRSKGA